MRGIKLVEPAILHGDGGDASAPNVSEDVRAAIVSLISNFHHAGLSVSNWIFRTELHNRR